MSGIAESTIRTRDASAELIAGAKRSASRGMRSKAPFLVNSPVKKVGDAKKKATPKENLHTGIEIPKSREVMRKSLRR